MVEIIDYAKATPEEIQVEMITDYKAKKLAEAEQSKISAFQKAKELEMDKLRARNDAKIIAFGQACQTAEDAGYDISKIPDGDNY